MGLVDAFTADARVELKVGDLYDILRVSAGNEKTAEFLKNAIDCEVPYEYIREVMTGKRKEPKENCISVENPRDILDAAIDEAMTAARVAAAQAGVDLSGQGTDINVYTQIDAGGQSDAGSLKDCAPESVSCGDCPKKELCDGMEDIAETEEETWQQDEPVLPFDAEESEGGKG